MPYKNAYQEALLEARNAALSGDGIPRRAYDLLLRVFGRAIIDIDRDLGSGRITAERGAALRRQINRRIIELGRRLGILLDEQKQSMIRAAIAGHEQGIARAAEITGVSVAVNFNSIPDRALEMMMLRRGLFGARDYKSVINRGLIGLADDIDEYIGSAIARGVNSRTASQELAALLSQGNDDILRYVEEGRLTRSAINKALRGGDLNLEQYQQARSIFTDSRRILVTETNTAFREADRLAAKESPVVGGYKWEVSSRHYGLPSSPDICTMYHETDLFGMGAGVFPVDNFPATPHPYCLPADSLVIPRGKVKSVSKRWFDGNVIIIHTAGGYKLTCTPNHPVLTKRGFVDADTLNVGDKVINNTVIESPPIMERDNINKPTPIKEIFESFIDNPAVFTIPVPAPTKDIDGNRGNSKVGIIGSYRFLRGDTKSVVNESIVNSDFGFGNISSIQSFFLNCFRFLALSLKGNRGTSYGIMSRFNLFLSLLFGQIRPNYFPRLTCSTNTNISLFKSFPYAAPANAKLFGKGVFGNTGLIKADNFVNREDDSTGHNDGVLAHQILNGKKEPIKFDEIIKIEVKEYHDFVYNIETTERYYIANGIATHNCGCYSSSVIRDVEEWNNPKQTLTQPPELSEGQFSSMFEDATPRKLETQVENANKYLRLAYEVGSQSDGA